MKSIIIGVLMLLVFNAFATENPQKCIHWVPLFRPFCHRLHQTWNEGTSDLYISGYSWHNRYTYSQKRLKRKHYNELAWGGGLGKGFFDDHGNWHSLYGLAFLDSHKNLEPVIGYAYLLIASLNKDIKAGLGYSILITARPDILHNVPFPGVVPWSGLFIKNVSLKAAYILGSSRNGNVLYIVSTYSFDT